LLITFKRITVCSESGFFSAGGAHRARSPVDADFLPFFRKEGDIHEFPLQRLFTGGKAGGWRSVAAGRDFFELDETSSVAASSLGESSSMPFSI